jgi:hypothetical protein
MTENVWALCPRRTTMGVDLRLLPTWDASRPCAFSHAVIPVERDYELFDDVRAMKTEPVDRDFHTFVSRMPNGEYGYGTTIVDAYGSPLRYVTAGDLALVLKKHGPSPAAAYVAALAPDAHVVLYWH